MGIGKNLYRKGEISVAQKKKEREYLISKGWRVKGTGDHCVYINPREPETKYSGYTRGYALDIQNEYDIWDTGRPNYVVAAQRNGYGYFISERTQGENGRVKRKTIFRAKDKKTCENLVDKLLKGKVSAKDLSVDSDKTDYRKILILHEKHGEHYFDVGTLDKLHGVALSIVKGRHKEGYWYYEPEEPKPLALTQEQANALPEGRVKEAALSEIKSYNNNLRYYKSELISWKLLQRAIKEDDGAAAWEYLESRRSAEYERYSLETLKDSYV